MLTGRYALSEDLLEKTLRIIPLGTQTYSKSKTQYPRGVSPYFITKGRGSRVWDVDGNEYIDFVNSLAAVTLGYNDPSVNRAVRNQLRNGVLFSLPHPLELEVAKIVTEMVPCAEMVRFGKNGSDATSGAVRLARAYTKRDHIVVCGYHGWQDWYIGSTSRNAGVPKCVQELTHSFIYNEIDSLKKLFSVFPDQIAAVMLEPMNKQEPRDGFLSTVKNLAHENGALLIFDEVITGFRFANGGAQEYFGVIPDLATFGKGLANGFPLSAIAGRKEFMQYLEDIFFSFTFGGETLSLAAAKATLEKLQKEPVVNTLKSRGTKVRSGAESLIQAHDLGNVIRISGHPAWSFLNFTDTPEANQWQIKTLFLQEVFSRGILTLGSHNMSYAHTDKDVERLLDVYDETFAILKKAIKSQNINDFLKGEVLTPLFTVR